MACQGMSRANLYKAGVAKLPVLVICMITRAPSKEISETSKQQ